MWECVGEVGGWQWMGGCDLNIVYTCVRLTKKFKN